MRPAPSTSIRIAARSIASEPPGLLASKKPGRLGGWEVASEPPGLLASKKPRRLGGWEARRLCQVLLDRRNERLHVDRLRDVSVAARFAEAVLVAAHRMRRQREDRDAAGALVCFHLAHDRPAPRARQGGAHEGEAGGRLCLGRPCP